MPGYLDLTEKQSVSATLIPAQAGPGPAELGLHSIHSTGYASHSSRAAMTRRRPVRGGELGEKQKNPLHRSSAFTERIFWLPHLSG